MRVIKHLRQPTSSTCVHTCIAMVSGKSVAVVRKDAAEMFGPGAESRGMGLQHEFAMLTRYKVDYNYILFGQLRFPGLYMASVPSLNLEGRMHRVVIDMRYDYEADDYNREVLDPQKGTGKRYYEFDKVKGRKGIELTSPMELIQVFT